jgi:hypothetical protein
MVTMTAIMTVILFAFSPVSSRPTSTLFDRHSLSLLPRGGNIHDLVRVRRAIFNLIPTADEDPMMTRDQRQKELVGMMAASSAAAVQPGAPGCICSDGTQTCVLDSRRRCRRVLSFPPAREEDEEEEAAADEATEDEEDDEAARLAEAEKLHNSRRHVKRRLASLLMKWLKLEESRRLIAAAAAANQNA